MRLVAGLVAVENFGVKFNPRHGAGGNFQESENEMETKIFDLRSVDMATAYGLTQSAAAIRHGDVLLVADGVAVLYLAWPCMVAGASDVFHGLADGSTWDAVAVDLAAEGRADKAAQLRAGVDLARRPLADLVAAAVDLADLAEGAAA